MKPVEPTLWTLYRDRADAYFRAMLLCKGDQQYEGAVPLLAVHSAISLADAVLVQFIGKRGSSSHREAAAALRTLCGQAKASGVAHLEKLVRNKTDWEYGDRVVAPDEIDLAYNQAERFYAWVNNSFDLSRARIP